MIRRLDLRGDDPRIPRPSADAALKRALAFMSVRDAADAVAQSFQEPRRRIYRRALELAKDGDD